MVRVAERPRDTVSTFQRRRVEPQAAAAATATGLPEAGLRSAAAAVAIGP
jgi:hypothetical protein